VQLVAARTALDTRSAQRYRHRQAHAHSVVILADERQDQHADGIAIVCCIAVKNVCLQERQPNIVAECQDPKYRAHMRKVGADEVISAADFGLRLMARASLSSQRQTSSCPIARR
jgi:hypothetical protein